jgi:hypothetical protein
MVVQVGNKMLEKWHNFLGISSMRKGQIPGSTPVNV